MALITPKRTELFYVYLEMKYLKINRLDNYK